MAFGILGYNAQLFICSSVTGVDNEVLSLKDQALAVRGPRCGALHLRSLGVVLTLQCCNGCCIHDPLSGRSPCPEAFVSLSEAASYFAYPLAADHVDYTIVLVDNGMTQVVRPTSEFIVG